MPVRRLSGQRQNLERFHLNGNRSRRPWSGRDGGRPTAPMIMTDEMSWRLGMVLKTHHGEGVIGLEGGYSPSFKHGVWMVQPAKA